MVRAGGRVSDLMLPRARPETVGTTRPAVSLPRNALAGAVVVGAALVLAINLGRGREYWEYSEGVYVLTSRLLLHGGDLYGTIVGAQPPGVYLTGGGLLAVHDGLLWVRAVVGAVQLAAGILAATLAWRLTASRVALAAVPLALVLPWSLREHGALTPEPFGAVLLLGAALLAVRRRPVAAGVLAGVAVLFKLPFVLPAAAVLLAAPRPRTAVAAGAGTAAVLMALSLTVFGDGLWHDAVVAQLHSGRLGLHALAGLWAQAAWSLGGLLVAAAVGVALRRQAREAIALRVAAALAAGWLLTILTNAKHGTSLNILLPVETALLPLALAGAAWSRAAGRRGAVALATAGVAFALLQSVTLLATPGAPSLPFLYPGSQHGSWARVASATTVDRAVDAARACPTGVPYGGPPLVAFLADRPMPGGQPDGFLPTISPTLRDVAARIAATPRVCPAGGGALPGVQR